MSSNFKGIEFVFSFGFCSGVAVSEGNGVSDDSDDSEGSGSLLESVLASSEDGPPLKRFFSLPV